MSWWMQTLAGLAGSAILGYWGWIGVQIVRQGTKIVELEKRLQQQEKTCCERLAWMQKMDEKLDTVAEGVAKITGILERR